MTQEQEPGRTLALWILLMVGAMVVGAVLITMKQVAEDHFEPHAHSGITAPIEVAEPQGMPARIYGTMSFVCVSKMAHERWLAACADDSRDHETRPMIQSGTCFTLPWGKQVRRMTRAFPWTTTVEIVADLAGGATHLWMHPRDLMDDF